MNCGATVGLVGQDTESMKKMCKEGNFKKAVIFGLDLVRDIQIFDLKSSVVERLQNIDILVNCAGVNIDGDIEKTYPQELDYSVDLNVRANFIIIKNLANYLEKNASIINIGCLYGNRPMVGMISGCISKAGLEVLTKYVAAELAPNGVRVNTIVPCPVETNIMRLLQVSETEINSYRDRMKKNIPMGRIAKPDDIVKVVSFLASKRSRRITGQIIRVDGGRGLTSSGYVHYKGCYKMNSRFEPDGVASESWFKGIKNLFPNSNSQEHIPEDKKELEQFIMNKIKESNFSTTDQDAHITLNANYKNVENNDEKLKDKYLNNDEKKRFDENTNAIRNTAIVGNRMTVNSKYQDFPIEKEDNQ